MPRYIDADALIDFLDVGHLRHPSELCFSEIDVANLLLHAPTISPDEARGVGKWEQKEIFGVKETAIEQMQSACCSVCGKYHTTPYSYYFSKYNYCPSCGARMKGAEDGTTD